MQDLTLTCVIAFCINIYYGTLSEDTPEVLPSAHRATGNSIAVACNRIMGIIFAVVASEGSTGTRRFLIIKLSGFVAVVAIKD
ncbi:hypothetical protein K456DRAFT_1723010 [Colletotrichum gloeosporioides 23]|nr:hypothetical protein K456DRAFT_1723010 [Colletotrichum gloeosporioides 23]